ncbi:DUF3868 domain-containing protein [Alistipes onderdonkii]|uniref:DUF3868 domain-containing protein n=2 Tax=Alistipes onderdonkii TaxID=328813 RepID=A0A5B3GZV3_9BACT|nr:DUF3868 domain-containing protein [Alistipes onderdonkii]KAA2383601.1 DUF3868 domain-containing protein [Alistipes onderdonkii]KAA2387783.1 DUF3868 domain-containing protein [Alistipes onderdonkii]KAA2389845.1 DUF3868 domain-containing protein [Alistipes onderdonkii]KAA2395690.1 DUF3868 domain-containing protein [Alistipes onderdonkii]
MILLAACPALFCPVPGSMAQVRQGSVTVQVNELAQRGDSLYVDMAVTTEGRNVPSRMSADFTPVLVSGERSLALPAVSLMGRNSYRNHRRALALMSAKERGAYEKSAPYYVVPDYKGDSRMDYRLALPYEAWMSSAQLTLQRIDCGCGKSSVTDVRLLAGKVSLEEVIVIERYRIEPHLAYIRPEAEAVKSRAEQGESFLDFAVGKTSVNPEFGRNAAELEKIRRMIDLVQDDKDLTIKRIVIVGYASPEGSLAMNERLSEGRAKALRDYLQSRYPAIPGSLYSIRFGGENWDDLVKAVQTSDMPDKQAVLDIIDRYSIIGGREAKLMALKGGTPWRYMLREMFPSLRKVTVTVDYDVRNFDAEEAKAVVKTRPQNLSLNELYLVANTYEPGSEDFNSLFETAVRLYPESVTATVNAAVAALERRDFVGAERYLRSVKSPDRIPECDNAWGLLLMLRDQDYDRAAPYFEAARAAGLKAAQQNLDEIDRLRRNLDEIKTAELKNGDR